MDANFESISTVAPVAGWQSYPVGYLVLVAFEVWASQKLIRSSQSNANIMEKGMALNACRWSTTGTVGRQVGKLIRICSRLIVSVRRASRYRCTLPPLGFSVA